MPRFEIKNIDFDNDWIQVPDFKSKGKLVNDVDGRQYKIIDKRQYAFSVPAKIGRGLLGTIAFIFTLSIAYFCSKSVRDLFKSKENKRIVEPTNDFEFPPNDDPPELILHPQDDSLNRSLSSTPEQMRHQIKELFRSLGREVDGIDAEWDSEDVNESNEHEPKAKESVEDRSASTKNGKKFKPVVKDITEKAKPQSESSNPEKQEIVEPNDLLSSIKSGVRLKPVVKNVIEQPQPGALSQHFDKFQTKLSPTKVDNLDDPDWD